MAFKSIIARVQQIRRNHDYWISGDSTILRQGEIGIDLDYNIFKIGNGTSKWSQLPSYFFGIKEDGTTEIRCGEDSLSNDFKPITLMLCNESSTKYSSSYIPKKGEPVSILTNNIQGVKIGDGIHTIAQLKFICPDDDITSINAGTVEDFVNAS